MSFIIFNFIRNREMNKVLIIIIAILFGCLPSLHSQQARQLSFCFTTLENQEINGKKVYLSKQDTIFADYVTSKGCATFYVDYKISMDDVYIVAREENGFVSRINLDVFFEYDCPVILTSMKVQMVENKLVNGIQGNTLSPLEHHRLWGGGYSKEYIESLFGEGHWYYPTELLISCDSSLNAYASYRINPESFFSEHGYYPQKRTLDSIKDAFAFHSAEYLIGWYSRQLIQLNEPVMCNGYSQNAYRFVWSGGQKMQYFTYDPYCLRVEFDSFGSATLYCHYCLFDECDENQTYCDVIFLNESKTDEFLKYIEELCFWTSKSVNDNGGKSIIFEANVNGQYHVIFRGEGEDPALDELQKFLWSLTGLGENKIVHKRQRIE